MTNQAVTMTNLLGLDCLLQVLGQQVLGNVTQVGGLHNNCHSSTSI